MYSVYPYTGDKIANKKNWRQDVNPVGSLPTLWGIRMLMQTGLVEYSLLCTVEQKFNR